MAKQVLLDVEQYNGEWMPENLAAAIAWLQAKLDSIPPEYRYDATIDLSTVRGYYEDSYPNIRIEY